MMGPEGRSQLCLSPADGPRDIIAVICSLTVLNSNTQINTRARPNRSVVVVVVEGETLILNLASY
jgi:hypothetical protein